MGGTEDIPIEMDKKEAVSIHLFTDCQPAIITAFDKKPPTSKSKIVTKIKECCNILYSKGNSMNVHWVPGHQDIRGNELAVKQAKEAAAVLSEWNRGHTNRNGQERSS